MASQLLRNKARCAADKPTEVDSLKSAVAGFFKNPADPKYRRCQELLIEQLRSTDEGTEVLEKAQRLNNNRGC